MNTHQQKIGRGNRYKERAAERDERRKDINSQDEIARHEISGKHFSESVERSAESIFDGFAHLLPIGDDGGNHAVCEREFDRLRTDKERDGEHQRRERGDDAHLKDGEHEEEKRVAKKNDEHVVNKGDGHVKELPEAAFPQILDKCAAERSVRVTGKPVVQKASQRKITHAAQKFRNEQNDHCGNGGKDDIRSFRLQERTHGGDARREPFGKSRQKLRVAFGDRVEKIFEKPDERG